MKTMRFWVGTGLLTLICVLIILAIAPGEHVARNGRVVGRVKYHGRPLVGGAILFFPDEPKRADFGRASIDEQGRFTVESDWRREGRTRFRICVFLDPNKYPKDPHPAQDGAAPSPDQGGAAAAHVIPASMGSKGLAFPGASQAGASDPPPRRFSSPATSGLSVQLGPEPARIDINLKD
jgi:hypothetical protein